MAAGKLVDGGAIFEKHPEEGKDALFKGSVIVYSANDAEEVRAILEKDVYATSGVWDLSKAQILPVSRVLSSSWVNANKRSMSLPFENRFHDEYRWWKYIHKVENSRVCTEFKRLNYRVQ